ncbi:MAG: ABC transporter substrate-binding protein [Gammaproteobacteria bacterium]|jgi:phospholipid transport system substrate-binding protein|nr:ABC transporter substrate-binding protein [Gammaproteobacteria bacterium]MBT4462924.1 ABC transporter substrate-binding protein [Gammaproteobacteria bacterium]MBT4654653.1 ABC transporter substrate-binding protein [Gammaproteobacteria bacterium]MBT5116360.1 ABC transporter substrate-binding protein [Gammaproteobacteria bacterium]MBT5761339.1 ABC transporter substrate-binding protein [Gammaproteobacteria bacterium]
MKIIKYIITFFLFFSTAIHAASAPDVFLKDSVREVSQFISENKDMLENDQSFLQSKVDGLIIPKLDILLMSKIVLGKKNWLSLNKHQRDRFVLAFRGLMVRTYMKSLTAFDGEKIFFLPYAKGKRPDVARVQSKYLLSEGEISVNYSLKLNKDDQWKVYDINIDGISLLKNYRADFRNHIEQQGIVSLINVLEEKK